MVYQSQNMRLKTVRLIARNDTNEITICENLNDSARGRFVVIIVKDHDILKRFIELNEQAEEVQDKVLIDCFSCEGQYLIVYPYKNERPFDLFYVGGAMSLQQAEEVCINLIIACMTSNLPWPLLYLVLTQKQVHIARDNSVYLTYAMDLAELDTTIGEKDCVVECAKVLLKVLSPKVKRGRKANSYVLLTKKIDKRAYGRFRELYKDLELAAVQEKKRGWRLRLRIWFENNRDTLFRVILVISIALAIFVVLTFLTNLIFGDVPWLRLFIRSFEKIGLESLLQ
ncbi:MAG: hypothetical protein IJJ13_10400 [Lachnospiraceae bacterium]|nr:hypothetical protein [Lachnospiraceae bacterium]